MSQQLQITGGAKVRDLQDVIIGTSGVLSSLAFNVANGVPKLDVNGKILVSQLPNSVMEYLGTWDASTNTPTLVNGTGNQGDVYLCNVAGTINFGAGPITFAVGDSAIYSGTIWQKAGGATGTVTSVGLTSTGNDAITITGSPITTSGNINLGFAGTNLQYINGAGDLTTFPTLISSIGLTMPSAFSVANSPLTSNGTIAVTGAGVASQYIRGDGTLANFPTSGGGGSSVAYYFNSSVSQGTLGGVAYRELSKVPIIGAGTDITIATNGYIANYITDAGDPSLLEIPAGNWNFEMFFSASSGGGSPSFYVELYKYDGTTFTLISSSSATPEGITNGTAIDLYTTALAVPLTTLTLTDRLAIRVYVNNSGRTITLHTENSHLCEVITTFSTGIAALNGLTAQVQYFATGTSGTDFNISSATATHTFNLPVASASNTGKLSSTDWSTFNGKVPYTGAIANVDLGNFNFDANEISGGSIIAKLNGPASSPFILMTGSSGYIFGYDAISLISSPTTANTLILTSNIGVVTKTAQIGLGSLTATRTYTLPDASGTLALLESSQTFTGINTFSSASRNESGILLKNGFTTYSNSYTSLGGNIGNLIISGSISGTPFDNELAFTPSTSNTYTFPNATGTLALTSNLSSYVPYTGATTNVNLGVNDFTSRYVNSQFAFIQGDGTMGGVLGFTQYATSYTSTSNNTNIYALGNNKINFSFYQIGGAFKIFNFDVSSLDTTNTRAYTLPNASGTLALTSDIPSLANYVTLTTTQTISGAKTFTSDLNAAKVAIANSNTLYTTTGYTTLSASNVGTTSWIAYVWGNVGGAAAILSFDNTAQYTYTFPATSGTIALTSNLSSYLPLAGGTLTGALGGTSAIFSSNLAVFCTPYNTTQYSLEVNGGLLVKNTGRTASLTIIDGDPSAGNNDGFVQIKTGGITTAAYSTIQTYYGSSNVAGSLQLQPLGGNVLIGTTTNASYKLDVSGNARITTSAYFATASGKVGIGTTSATYTLSFNGDVATTIGMNQGTLGSQVPLTLKGSDSPTGTNNEGGPIYISSGLGTGNATTSNIIFSTAPSAGGGTTRQTLAERMRITSGGNVSIGTTSDNYRLEVNANAATWATRIYNASSTGLGLIISTSTTSQSYNAFGIYNGTDYLMQVKGDGLTLFGLAANSPYNRTTGTAANAVMLSDGGLGRNTSSLKYKKNVKDYTRGLSEVLQLRPIFYEGKSDIDTGKTFAGLIAEEVHDLGLTEFVTYAEDGSPDALAYGNMVALLTKAIQEQQALITSLQSRLDNAGL